MSMSAFMVGTIMRSPTIIMMSMSSTLARTMITKTRALKCWTWNWMRPSAALVTSIFYSGWRLRLFSSAFSSSEFPFY